MDMPISRTVESKYRRRNDLLRTHARNVMVDQCSQTDMIERVGGSLVTEEQASEYGSKLGSIRNDINEVKVQTMLKIETYV